MNSFCFNWLLCSHFEALIETEWISTLCETFKHTLNLIRNSHETDEFYFETLLDWRLWFVCWVCCDLVQRIRRVNIFRQIKWFLRKLWFNNKKCSVRDKYLQLFVLNFNCSAFISEKINIAEIQFLRNLFSTYFKHSIWSRYQ